MRVLKLLLIVFIVLIVAQISLIAHATDVKLYEVEGTLRGITDHEEAYVFTTSGKLDHVVGGMNSVKLNSISREDLQSETGWLAAPTREGRATGTDGAKAAADWLAAYFKTARLQPLGDSYFQPFNFTAGERVIAEKTALGLRPPPLDSRWHHWL